MRSTFERFVAALALFIVIFSHVLVLGRARAGGTEFPGGGTRSLGRGGAAMARADDPSVMIRNPALLADLWDDQALLGANLLLVDACFRPSGGYGVGVTGPDVIKLGDEIIALNLPPGSTLPDGTPIPIYGDEPYPTVCYEGPAPFLPHVALTMKPSHDLGIGLGFFPPDNASLSQFGNRDGTVDTPNGLRPNPLRTMRTHQNVSYFSVLGAIGYRVHDWIRIGLGVQWQLVVFQSRVTTPIVSFASLGPRSNLRVDAFGRDLFVPGVIGSIHLKPLDALDVALGFKWSDRIRGKTKLDITTAVNSTSRPFDYIDGTTMMPTTIGSLLSTSVYNQRAEVNAPPIWVSQLSLALRYADRLKPRVRDEDRSAVEAASSGSDEDSMATERWDIELDVIYYMTSEIDRTDVTMKNVIVPFQTISPAGVPDPALSAQVGDCVEPKGQLPPGVQCKRQSSRTAINGQDQITARLGGDYNILPGLLSLRAGASYETDGQEPSWMSPFQYLSRRVGLHGGFSVRVARRTDFSVGFAYFIQKDVRLQLNPLSAADYRGYQSDPERYHLAPGELDGIAKIEVPNSNRPGPGPYFANAGSSYYDLSVLSASIAQHF